jgi:hypothetical protein
LLGVSLALGLVLMLGLGLVLEPGLGLGLGKYLGWCRARVWFRTMVKDQFSTKSMAIARTWGRVMHMG